MVTWFDLEEKSYNRKLKNKSPSRFSEVNGKAPITYPCYCLHRDRP